MVPENIHFFHVCRRNYIVACMLVYIIHYSIARSSVPTAQQSVPANQSHIFPLSFLTFSLCPWINLIFEDDEMVKPLAGEISMEVPVARRRQRRVRGRQVSSKDQGGFQGGGHFV